MNINTCVMNVYMYHEHHKQHTHREYHLPHAQVRAWALASRGYCLLRRACSADAPPPPPEFALWEDVARRGADAEARVAWCGLKGRPRALEKVWRAYGGDPSRLTDVCRQAVAFDAPGDLLACLRRVAADPDVRVLRVKNSLRAGHGAGGTAGFRMVLANLALATGAARRLGADLHVCELQLLLREFAALKSESGHRRYRIFRDQRAE